jgi:hypothetical protein
MLGGMHGGFIMATYKGDVIDSPQEDFPFMAIIYDETGTVVGEFPVRTRTDGEAKVVEALKELRDQAKDGGDLP